MQKKHKIFVMIANLGVGFLLGVVLMISPIKYAEYIAEISGMNRLLCFLIGLMLMVCFYFVGVIIHESGHLLMGLLTGYRFISFRIGSFVFVKENGRIVCRKYSLPGTLGQCLMTHDPVQSPDEIKYFWYHLGGGLFNFLTGAIALLVMFLSQNVVLDWLMFSFATISMYLALTNLIPMDLGITNDGMNIVMQKKYPNNRQCLLNILIVNGMQYEGKKMPEMPEFLFSSANPDGEIFEANAALMLNQRLLYEHRFQEAADIMCRMIHNDKITDMLKNEAKCELMFCKIILKEDREMIEGLYDKVVKSYIDQTKKYSMSRRRLMYVYALLMENDKTKAEAIYDDALQMKDTYPCRSEYESEIELLEYLRLKLCDEQKE